MSKRATKVALDPYLYPQFSGDHVDCLLVQHLNRVLVLGSLPHFSCQRTGNSEGKPDRFSLPIPPFPFQSVVLDPLG
jgi:hypothetical protein